MKQIQQSTQLSLLELPESKEELEKKSSSSSSRVRRRLMPRDSRSQISFADVAIDPGWALTRPPRRQVSAPTLSPEVRQEARRFEHQAVALGLLTRESARTKRKALECLAKQAQRFLGRDLGGLAELYAEEVIAAVVLDDEPFDKEAVQLGRATLRQRRSLFGQYLQIMGVPGLPYEDGIALIKRGFRLAAHRRGYRYILGAGRPEQRDGYRPPMEDVQRFFLATGRYGLWFAGHRLAAAAALSLYHGLRPVSLLNVRCEDFRWKGERLFLTIKEKRVKGKRERREVEVRRRVMPYLQAYQAAVNQTAAQRGWQVRLSISAGEGTFFLDQRGHPLAYDTLLRDFGACSKLASIQPFTAYGLRRLHASGLAALLPMGSAAAAGGWLNERVFGKHYARSLVDWQPRFLLAEPAIDLDEDMPYSTAAGLSREVTVGLA